MSGWLDSSLLADAGIPAVIFGPKGEGLHALEEWADLESVATCAQVYKRLMETYCA